MEFDYLTILNGGKYIYNYIYNNKNNYIHNNMNLMNISSACAVHMIETLSLCACDSIQNGLETRPSKAAEAQHHVDPRLANRSLWRFAFQDILRCSARLGTMCKVVLYSSVDLCKVYNRG